MLVTFPAATDRPGLKAMSEGSVVHFFSGNYNSP